MATAHNNAERGQIAGTVIMPGDPLRAKFIADNWLDRPKMFNHVRNMYGYTGTYHGRMISVMGSGMGMPSMGIYSYELFHIYNVDEIIRVGSAGSYCKELNVFDTVLVTEAYSESSYARTMSGFTGDVTKPSQELNEKICLAAKEQGRHLIEGRVHSTDVFYREGTDYYQELYREKGCLAVEMESFALFHNAAVCGKRASCILTISDSFVSQAKTTAEEREKCFTEMIEIALGAAKK